MKDLLDLSRSIDLKTTLIVEQRSSFEISFSMAQSRVCKSAERLCPAVSFHSTFLVDAQFLFPVIAWGHIVVAAGRKVAAAAGATAPSRSSTTP